MVIARPGGGAEPTIDYRPCAGGQSRRYRPDKAETWHFYAGNPLALAESATGHVLAEYVLGTNLAA